ncbi:MAG: hypothetical protein ACI4V2_01565 [Alloprevotella sp.]
MAGISVLMPGRIVLIAGTTHPVFDEFKPASGYFGEAFEILRKPYIPNNKAVTISRTVYKENFEPSQTNANKVEKSQNRPAFCH